MESAKIPENQIIFSGGYIMALNLKPLGSRVVIEPIE